jgi:hypothetical protein
MGNCAQSPLDLSEAQEPGRELGKKLEDFHMGKASRCYLAEITTFSDPTDSPSYTAFKL